MSRDWREDDELRELEKDEISHGWRPSQETLQAIEGDVKDVSENLLKVKGFEKAEVLGNEDVAEYLSTELPEEHTERVTQIEYTDKYDGDEGGYVAGCCITDTKNSISTIEINRQSSEGSYDKEEMKRTITHEVGHSVYYSLNEEQRNQWSEIYANSSANGFVSDYAQTNEREDFAESYVTYVHDLEYLKVTSTAKYDFMRQYVF